MLLDLCTIEAAVQSVSVNKHEFCFVSFEMLTYLTQVVNIIYGDMNTYPVCTYLDFLVIVKFANKSFRGNEFLGTNFCKKDAEWHCYKILLTKSTMHFPFVSRSKILFTWYSNTSE